jgi:hypothetical protein
MSRRDGAVNSRTRSLVQTSSAAAVRVSLPRAWLWSAAAVSAFLTLATALTYVLEARGGALAHGTQFSMAYENNLGAWFAGALLLMAALHAADGWYRRELPEGARRAWAALALVLAALSADEVASLHERVGSNFGTLALVPFGLVLGALTLYALLGIARVPTQRRHVAWIVFAFVLFALTAVQEFLEHHIHWWGDFPGLRVAIEEGTEMIATLILLRAGMSNTAGRFATAVTPTEVAPAKVAPTEVAPADRPVFEVLHHLRSPLLLAGLLAAPVLAWASLALPDPQRGIPLSWLASTLFLASALVVADPFLRRGQALGLPRLALAGLCVLLSAMAVAWSPLHRPTGGTLILTTGVLAICALWLATSMRVRAPTWVVAAAAVLALLPWIGTRTLLPLVAYGVIGAILLYGVTGARKADTLRRG